MASRIELQALLESVLGSRNVYFQPPESVKMSYPAIVYSLSTFYTRFADNAHYRSKKAYTITLMDKNPDSEYVEKLYNLPMCGFDRHYKADNLNHWIFKIYF